MNVGNLFENVPKAIAEECVSVLASNSLVRIERIVSTGQSSPEDCWYDQDQREWVMVIRGEAHLIFEGEKDVVVMKPGDHIEIATHRRHRVAWTSLSEPTIWLAVFFSD